MSWSYLPRWKFTDSCGRPRVPGAIHLGCAHSEHTQCAHTSRRAFLKGGIAIVGGAAMATVIDPAPQQAEGNQAMQHSASIGSAIDSLKLTSVIA